MMDTNEAIKLLKGMQGPLQDYADMVGAPESTKGIRYVYPDQEDYAIEAAISALEEQDKYRWIPVEERLPEKEGVYIVTFAVDEKVRAVGYGCCRKDVLGEDIGFGWYDLCSGTYFSDKAFIAWMPLPAPYQKEEKR